MGLFRRSAPIDPAEVDQLRAELASLRQALDQHQDSAQALRDKLASLDDRVTSVSTELANQLTELGHDLDALAEHPPEAVDQDALTAIRDGQVKLANEQVRYQIAFREDLARLAKDLKRPR
jgi:septal ring factor EnvC (AmiA/AmiB activator)